MLASVIIHIPLPTNVTSRKTPHSGKTDLHFVTSAYYPSNRGYVDRVKWAGTTTIMYAECW